MPVQVLAVVPEKIADTSEYLAILKSRHSATINPQVEGHVTGIDVKSGDRVKTGDALLQIDPMKQEPPSAARMRRALRRKPALKAGEGESGAGAKAVGSRGRQQDGF